MVRSRRCAAPRRRVAALALLLVACRREPQPSATQTIDLLALGAPSVTVETRIHRFGVDDRAPLLSGWSSRNERDRRRRPFVWATAEEARFALSVLRVEDKQALVTLRGYPSADPQGVDVVINDRPLADLPLETDDREFRFVIPAEMLHLGENVLAFRHAFLTPGPNPRDPRRFAAAYASLLVGPACLPLRADGEPKPPQVERRKAHKSISITGPAALSWTVDVPAGAIFVAKVALPSRSPGPADVSLEAHVDGEWVSLADTRLHRPWIFPNATVTLSGDLRPIAGRRTELRIRVLPLPCSSALTTIRVKRAAIALQSADRP